MGFRLICALLLLISLIAELSFDNTNSFVRVSPEVTPLFVLEDSPESPASIEDSLSVASPVVPGSSENTESGKHPFGKSLGHFASLASTFQHIVHEDVHRLATAEPWHYRFINRFAILRPPIQA